MADYVGTIESLTARNPELAEKLREKGMVKHGRFTYRLVKKTGNVYRVGELSSLVF